MSDMVERPNHYVANGVEAIEVIQAWCLGYELGCAVKYILRAGRKSAATEIEDLRKACKYLTLAEQASGPLFTAVASNVPDRLRVACVAEAFGIDGHRAYALNAICTRGPEYLDVVIARDELRTEIERLQGRPEAA